MARRAPAQQLAEKRLQHAFKGNPAVSISRIKFSIRRIKRSTIPRFSGSWQRQAPNVYANGQKPAGKKYQHMKPLKRESTRVKRAHGEYVISREIAIGIEENRRSKEMRVVCIHRSERRRAEGVMSFALARLQ